MDSTADIIQRDQEPEMEEKKYYHAYEDRYNRVYSTGARYWNQHEPSRALKRFLHKYGLKKGRLLEMGCGEGFEARFLARSGFDVTGVDISPTVVEKCRIDAEAKGLSIEFRLGDMTRLDFFPDRSFDLVVAVGSYHMLNDPKDRAKCMAEMARLLKPGGYLFLQNGLSLKEAEKYFPEDREEIAAFRKVRLGKEVTRTLTADNGRKDVSVPVTPKTFFGSVEDFEREAAAAGLRVIQSYATNEDKINAGWEAVVIVQKEKG